MKTEKQLRVLETKGRYKVVDGRLWTLFKGEWRERSACVTGGYRQHILFNGRGWGKVIAYEHEVVWLYERGLFDPALVIDHINHDRMDNRIENLRPLTPAENKLASPPDEYHTWYNVTDSGQIYRLIDSYASGMSKSAAAREAKIPRLNGLYHINRFLQTGTSSYLDADVNKFFRDRLDLQDVEDKKHNEVVVIRKP